MKIGLIGGLVGDELKKDVWGTLRKVAEIGYEGIEGAGRLVRQTELSPAEVVEKLQEVGLEPITAGSVGSGADEAQVQRAIDGSRALGCRYVVQYWGPCESEEQLLEEARQLDRIGRRCREAGLRFLYHNHNHEFARFGDSYGLDILMDNTDPDNVGVELDVAWVTFGGADPAELIRNYAGRCPMLHMKDLAEVPEGGSPSNEGRGETQFTEVGTGVVDTEGAVEAARQAGVEWLVVEQDRMRDLSPMESIQVSFQNLREAISG